MTVVLFAENTIRGVMQIDPTGTIERENYRTAGGCVETVDAAGMGEHRAADDPAQLPPEAAAALAHVLTQSVHAFATPSEPILRELARETGAVVRFAGLHQRVVAGNRETQVEDQRRYASVEVEIDTPSGPVSEARLSTSTAIEVDDIAALVDELRSRAYLPSADPSEIDWQQADLVLLPGRAGAFFHELVGHPLEADVLATGTSWLSGRRGEVIGPRWLTVVDGPSGAEGGFRSAIDDEGTESTPAVLLDNGRVCEPMTDAMSATRLGFRRTGHGRRLNYRHPAIPRMTHTVATIEPGIVTAPPVRPYLAPLGVRLESMNLATGNFVFRANESLWCEPGAVTHRFGAIEICGNAGTALGALMPVDPAILAYGRANRGCGKLGQFPLPASFANAGMSLPANVVSVRKVLHG